METIKLPVPGGWYVEYPKGYSQGDPRAGEYWLYNKDGIGYMIVAFEEHGALEFCKAMNSTSAAMQPSGDVAALREEWEAESNQQLKDILSDQDRRWENRLHEQKVFYHAQNEAINRELNIMRKRIIHPTLSQNVPMVVELAQPPSPSQSTLEVVDSVQEALIAQQAKAEAWDKAIEAAVETAQVVHREQANAVVDEEWPAYFCGRTHAGEIIRALPNPYKGEVG